MRTKIFTGILAGVLMLALVGCGEKKASKEDTKVTENPKQVTENNQDHANDENDAVSGKEDDKESETVKSLSEEEVAALPAVDLNWDDHKNAITELFKSADGGVLTVPSYIKLENSYYRIEGVTGFRVSYNSYELNEFKDGITKVVLPDTVTSIKNSFSEFSNLKEVTLPSNLKSIEDSFSDCPNLTEIVIPETVESVKAGSFENCTNLASVQMNGNKTAIIGMYNFKNTAWLNNLLSEDEDGFVVLDGQLIACGASGVSISLPVEVERIAGGAFDFEACDIDSLNIFRDNIKLYEQAFGSIYDTVDSVNFFGHLTCLDDKAFYASNVKNVLFIDVEKIGDWAFFCADELVKVSLPGSVKEIGENAFNGAEKLSSIFLPSSLETIGDYAFENCKSLKTVAIPEGITEIGQCTFRMCDDLETVFFPTTLKSIGYMAFNDCTSLKTIAIPGNVTEVGRYAFEGCNNLETLELCEGTVSLGADAFAFCKKLKAVVLPNTITELGDDCFRYCSSLESVTMTDSVTTMGSSVFGDCESLKNVTLSNSLTEIPNYAFSSCTSLETIVIPEGVTSLGQGAFEDCVNLSITVPKNCEIGYNTLLNVKSVK